MIAKFFFSDLEEKPVVEICDEWRPLFYFQRGTRGHCCGRGAKLPRARRDTGPEGGLAI